MNSTLSEEIHEKKQHIINVAEQLFAENGFDGTSVRDIAHQAKVNIAMISYYFGSKEKLLESIIEKKYNFSKYILENLITNNELTPIEKIESLIQTFVKHAFKQQHFHKIMVREQIKGEHSQVNHLLNEFKSKNQSLVKKLIEEGQQKKIFRANIEVQFMLSTMFGTIHHLIAAQNFYYEENRYKFTTQQELEDNLQIKIIKHLQSIINYFLTNESA